MLLALRRSYCILFSILLNKQVVLRIWKFFWYLFWKTSTKNIEKKVLGLLWNPQLDCFSVTVNSNIYIKRNVLSSFAQMFDPLGFISPAKIFMQKLWICRLNWDDLLSIELSIELIKLLETISQLSQIKIKEIIT